MLNFLTKTGFSETFIFILRHELFEIVEDITKDIILPFISLFVNVDLFKKFNITICGKKIVFGKTVLKILTTMIILLLINYLFKK